MTKEALKLALEALNDLSAWTDGEVGGHMDEPYSAEVARRTITAIKEALAQPEPVAWEQFYPEMGKPQLIPPQRTWVGLTDGEVDKMILLMGFPPDWITENAIVKNIVRNLETKLKEKNT